MTFLMVISRNLVPPGSGSVALRSNPLHEKGAIKIFLKTLLSMMMILLSAISNKAFDLWLELNLASEHITYYNLVIVQDLWRVQDLLFEIIKRTTCFSRFNF